MQVLDFIIEHGFDALADRGIETRKYPDQQLFVLNYSQIDARKDDPVACECRGLIVDSKLNVLCRPFSRFFNYGEMNTKNFDFTDCTVWEKADGSLVKVWYNRPVSRWEIGTRGTAFAEANHIFGTKTDWTFREAILDAMRFSEDQFQNVMASGPFHDSCTYLFEYCSPYNRIVTKYDEPHVVLLSCISNITGIEANVAGLRKWVALFQDTGMNVRLPNVYQANSGEEIVKLAESLENLQEGFVVFNNKTGERVKVKSSVYVAVHQLRGNGSPTRNSLIELVLKNEQDELLTYFPEYKCFVDPVEEALATLQNQAVALYENNKHIESQKDFAIAINGFNPKVSPILFKARKDKTTVLRAFETMDLNQQAKLLEKYLGD